MGGRRHPDSGRRVSIDELRDWGFWEQYLKEHRPYIKSRIRTAGLADREEFLFQDIQTKAFESLRRLSAKFSPFTYLKHWVRDVIAGYWRKKKHDPISLDDGEESQDADPTERMVADPDDPFARLDAALDLEPLLNQLPPAQRRMIELHDLKGLEMKEIAARLERSMKGIKSAHAKAMKALKQMAAEAVLSSADPTRPPRCARDLRRRGRPMKILPCVNCARLRTRCLPALPPAEKSAIQARYLDHKTLVQVGHSLATTPYRVRVLLASAEAALRAHCRDRTN